MGGIHHPRHHRHQRRPVNYEERVTDLVARVLYSGVTAKQVRENLDDWTPEELRAFALTFRQVCAIAAEKWADSYD